MLIDNNAQKLTRAGGGRGDVRKSSSSPRSLPHPTTDLWGPLRDPASTLRATFLPAWRTRPCLSSPARRKQEGRADLRERPFRGSIRTYLRWGGGGRGGRGVASTRAASRKGRVSRGHGAEGRPFHYPATRLPLCFLVVEQLWLGRRHYHIALRGSRHLTAGTKEAGGRQAVKSTSGWSIEPLGGVAPRGAPSGPSTIERLRLGPERPPASGGPRWSPCRAGGPGTVPVRRRRHFTRASEVRDTRG